MTRRPDANVSIQFTPGEVLALLALARKGRVLMDVDPAFLGRRDQRADARAALRHLRHAAILIGA